MFILFPGCLPGWLAVFPIYENSQPGNHPNTNGINCMYGGGDGGDTPNELKMKILSNEWQTHQNMNKKYLCAMFCFTQVTEEKNIPVSFHFDNNNSESSQFAIYSSGSSSSLFSVFKKKKCFQPKNLPYLFWKYSKTKKKIIHADNRHVSSNIFDIFFLVFCSPDIFFFFWWHSLKTYAGSKAIIIICVVCMSSVYVCRGVNS